MFSGFKTLCTLVGNIAKVGDANSFRTATLLTKKLALSDVCGVQRTANALHTSVPRRRGEDRKQLAASMPKKDDGAAGEKSIDIDSLIQR